METRVVIRGNFNERVVEFEHINLLRREGVPKRRFDGRRKRIELQERRHEIEAVLVVKSGTSSLDN